MRDAAQEALEVPVLVDTRVTPWILGRYGVVVPPACHCEMGFVTRSQVDRGRTFKDTRAAFRPQRTDRILDVRAERRK